MLDIQELVHHPLEAALERYLLNQSPESEIEAVETHFLVCSSCTERLEDVAQQIGAIKVALQELHLEKVARSFEKRSTSVRWFSFRGISGLAAVAALVLAVATPHKKVSVNKKPDAKIELVAYRGVETTVLPTQEKVHLTLDATGLEGGHITVTLDDSEGQELWRTASEVKNDRVVLDVAGIRTPGVYYFRLCRSDPNPELREFAAIFQQDARAKSVSR